MTVENLQTFTTELTSLRATLRAEIHTFAHELRLLKRFWRTPPATRLESPPATRFPMHRSKLGATLACMLMAHSRGRRHLAVWMPGQPDEHAVSDLPAQAAVIERELRRMDDQERIGIVAPLFTASIRAAARAILARHR